MFYPTPTDALTQFVADQLPLTMLMRAFLEYQDWRCLGTRNEEELTPTCIATDESAGQNLILFSDADALSQAEKSGLIPANSGSFTLSPAEHHQLLHNVAGVWFNPATQPGIKLEGEDFKTYQALAQGIDVERCLAGVNEKIAVVGFAPRQLEGALFWQVSYEDMLHSNYSSARILEVARNYRDINRPRALCE